MQANRTPSLDIVIVNWNSGRLLRECLGSIQSALDSSFELRRLVVVDNGSTDESAADLGDLVPRGICLVDIGNPDNAGFARACNQGAAGSEADYILFLNPDTRLFGNSLVVPLEYMQSDAAKGVGICGVRIMNETGRVVASCSRFPTATQFLAKTLGVDTLFPKRQLSALMTEWAHDEDRDVDQLMGSFFLVRRTVFEDLGGFDERYFVYYEEVDFSLRARRAGWRSRFLSSAAIFHKGGGSSDAVRDMRLFYSLRSRIIYSASHFGPMRFSLVLVASLLVEFLTREIRALLKLSPADVAATASGYMRLWRTFPSTLSIAFEPPRRGVSNP